MTRHKLVNLGFRRDTVDLPFESAMKAARTGRIALAVDTSGSIDESFLRRSASEIAAVLIQTEPLLRLIVCDADVYQGRAVLTGL